MESGVSEEKKDVPKYADDEHGMLVCQFEEYVDGTLAVRALAEKCRDYRDGNQWSASDRKKLERRGQPCITDNKIADKVDTLQGIEKQMRTDPSAFPRNPSPEDEESAEAATDALRYIADDCNYKTATRKPAAENLIIEGLCAGQVVVERRKKRQPRVKLEHVRRDRVFYDIHSLKDDFEDKTYCGLFTWMDQQVALEEWPDAAEVLEQSVTWSSLSGPDSMLDDKPRYVITSNKRNRIQIFTHYFLKKGRWHEATWCRGGWLEKPKPCKYKDEFGEPMCCMEIQAMYRDKDGGPYGKVKRDLDLQDEHNKRRSKMLHLLNAKRIKLRKGVVDNINKLRNEAHKPDGVLEINGSPDDVVIEDNINEAEGQWRLLQQTDLALSQTGPNAAIQGISGDISGIAKQRDQQAGQLPISPLFDALDAWELRMYRQAWYRARQYWTGETWVRVTDDEKKVRFVGFNTPVLVGDMLAQKASQDPGFQQLPPEEQRAIIMDIASREGVRDQMIDPESKQLMVRNSIRDMDMDIIIDRGPDVATLQQEEFSTLVELAKSRPEVKFSTLVEMSQLRPKTKKRVLEDLSGSNDPLAKQQAMFQQLMEQLQALVLKAKAERDLAAAAKDRAAATESEVDAGVKVAEFASADAADPNAAPGEKPAASKTSVSVN